MWDSPFPAPADLIPAALAPIAEAPSTPRQSMPEQIASRAPGGAAPARIAVSAQARGARSDGTFALLGSGFAVGMDLRFAAAHQYLWHAGMRTQLTPPARLAAFGGGAAGDDPPCFAPAPAQQVQVGRWSLDAWGFWRQGSVAAPISQGRVPIYGASQIGAVLNYRLAPDNARDPRLFVRAYQALVRLSLGAGAWGGAQEGAHRVDLGPTMRLDVTLGAVPARISLDWRERVEGDAGPGSGAAVTLSTRF